MVLRRVRNRSRWRLMATALCLCLFFGVTPADAHKPGAHGSLSEFLARIRAFHPTPFKAPIRFPKWEDALNRFHLQRLAYGFRPFENQWNAFLATIRNDAPMEKLRRVQDYVNFFGYVREPQPSKGADYWKAPAEFFTASGDCEDYAIAKYWSLRKTGFSADALRILVVYAKRGQTAHTVLRARVDGRFYLLDSLYENVEPLDRIHDYVGLYGINAAHAYLFPQRDRLSFDVVYDGVTPLYIFDVPTSAGGKRKRAPSD